MNKIFRALTGHSKFQRCPSAKVERKYPIAYAFDAHGLYLGMEVNCTESVVDRFPNAKVLNIKHRNGKTTVIRL